MKTFHETVLLYSPSGGEDIKKIKGVCLRMGIRAKEASPSDLSCPLGALFGIKGFPPKEGGEGPAEPFPETILVMKGFTGRRMDAFFGQMKRSGVRNIALKAVLTEHNAAWDLLRLREELLREREAILQGKTVDHEEEPI